MAYKGTPCIVMAIHLVAGERRRCILSARAARRVVQDALALPGHNFMGHNYMGHTCIGACYAPLESSRRGGRFEYRHVHTRAIDVPSAMADGAGRAGTLS